MGVKGLMRLFQIILSTHLEYEKEKWLKHYEASAFCKALFWQEYNTCPKVKHHGNISTEQAHCQEAFQFQPVHNLQREKNYIYTRYYNIYHHLPECLHIILVMVIFRHITDTLFYVLSIIRLNFWLLKMFISQLL